MVNSIETVAYDDYFGRARELHAGCRRVVIGCEQGAQVPDTGQHEFSQITNLSADAILLAPEHLRRFIVAYAEKSRSWSAEKQPQRKAWIEWATRHADRIDPFVSEKPPSVLDRQRELNRW